MFGDVWRQQIQLLPYLLRKYLHEWLLLSENKPIYGLNDAPLAWQLNVHDHLESQGGAQSVLDENLFFWKNNGLKALVTAHVDDLVVCADRKFLTEQYQAFSKKLPFSRCGSRCSAAAAGYRMDQTDFCENLKEVDAKDHVNDERDLKPEEQSILRSQTWWTSMVDGSETTPRAGQWSPSKLCDNVQDETP